MLTEKTKKRINRHKRIRAKISGTNSRPRISVFKSNISLQVQAINDETNKTILSGNTESKKGTKTEQSKDLGL
ncbi:MAG: 50S ribosomal protein L18, partial [Candidatus Pacebacteria bacterium]|nr:50S ribosomal protein L18 [Candidatus Paceibacterota bacterium]